MLFPVFCAESATATIFLHPYLLYNSKTAGRRCSFSDSLPANTATTFYRKIDFFAAEGPALAGLWGHLLFVVVSNEGGYDIFLRISRQTKMS
jgi:D-Tyr-tRNAtyr deacylase